MVTTGIIDDVITTTIVTTEAVARRLPAGCYLQAVASWVDQACHSLPLRCVAVLSVCHPPLACFQGKQEVPCCMQWRPWVQMVCHTLACRH